MLAFAKAKKVVSYVVPFGEKAEGGKKSRKENIR